MKCPFDRDLLQEYAVGEVTAPERSRVEEHLGICADCRLEVTDLRRIVRDLTALPEPDFPPDLEEVLVRSAIQAGRDLQTIRPLPRRTGIRPTWVYAMSGAVGLAAVIFLVVLLWPSRVGQEGPVGRMVGGGVGQGLGLLDSIMRWLEGVRSSWDAVSDYLGRFAPVGRAVRVAVAGVGSSLWTALALGGVAIALLLWRITGAGHKKMRSVDHAKPHC